MNKRKGKDSYSFIEGEVFSTHPFTNFCGSFYFWVYGTRPTNFMAPCMKFGSPRYEFCGGSFNVLLWKLLNFFAVINL